MKFKVLFSNPLPGRKEFIQLLLIMKLSVILIFIGCLQVSARTYSQHVTLSSENIPLKVVFREIEKQTGFHFFYRVSLAARFGNIDMHLQNVPLKDAMDLVLKDQPLQYKIINKTIVITQKANGRRVQEPVAPGEDAPAVNVSGTVTDPQGTPLAGASIKIKNTNRGVSTDDRGSYSLNNVPNDAVLVVSYIGFGDQEVRVQGRSVINIVMQPEQSGLNEVVVVGYGTQKKLNLTGAVDQVSGDRLESRPITNVSEGLQGLMANLNVTTTTGGGKPGTTKSINIRGYTGLGTTGEPLILVDGVPADINTVNPNDIESISVLKDAASSAIYGSRAPYGVILITTRQGKKGQAFKVSYTNNISFSQTINRPIPANSLEFANVMNEAAVNAGRGAIFSDYTIQKIKEHLADPSAPATEQDPGAGRGHLWLGYFGSYANTDWYKEFTKRWATNQQHNIGVNGGTEKLQYYVSVGYNGKGSVNRHFDDSYDRYNFRTNITSKVNDWLQFGIRTSLAIDSQRAATNSNGNWQRLFAKMVTSPVTVPTGGYWRDGVTYMKDGGATLGSNKDGWLMGDVTVTPLPGLEIKGSFNYNYNLFTRVAAATDFQYQTTDGSYIWIGLIPTLNKYSQTSNYYNYNAYASYDRKLGGHYFKLMAGVQREFKHFESLTAGNDYLYTSSLPALSLTYGTNYTVNDALYNWATSGTFVRFNYNYDEKYLLEFNGRYDGTSLFPENRRYQFFPSVSAGYNISKEAFWDPLKKVVSSLKLRGSYGQLGDISSLINAGSYYLSQSTLSNVAPTSTNWLFNTVRQPYVTAGSLVSADVTWAKPSMLDFGIDAGALDDRFQITFDWYRRRTKDLYGPTEQYPGILGINPPQRNNASIETKGFDLTASWSDNIGKLRYNARLIFSNYKGKVLNYPNPTGAITNWYNGMQMGEIWGYNTVGLFQTEDDVNKAPSQSLISANWYPGDVQYADLNGDGKVDFGNNTLANPGDQTVIGNITPRYNYGFTLSLDYKGFDFMMFIQGVGKREFWPGNSPFFWGIPGNGSEWGSQVLTTNLDRWTTATPNGYFPRYYLSGLNAKNQQAQTRYLLKGAYLRGKNLQIGYTLPQTLTRRAHIGRLRIYGSAENLFTIAPGLHNKYQIDPELLLSDGNIYPIQRTFSAGINLDIQ